MTNETTKLKLLGQNIQKFRKSKNLSQNQLTELLDISREHLAKVETAKRCMSLTLLFKLAEVLQIAESELFHFDM